MMLLSIWKTSPIPPSEWAPLNTAHLPQEQEDLLASDVPEYKTILSTLSAKLIRISELPNDIGSLYAEPIEELGIEGIRNRVLRSLNEASKALLDNHEDFEIWNLERFKFDPKKVASGLKLYLHCLYNSFDIDDEVIYAGPSELTRKRVKEHYLGVKVTTRYFIEEIENLSRRYQRVVRSEHYRFWAERPHIREFGVIKGPKIGDRLVRNAADAIGRHPRNLRCTCYPKCAFYDSEKTSSTKGQS